MILAVVLLPMFARVTPPPRAACFQGSNTCRSGESGPLEFPVGVGVNVFVCLLAMQPISDRLSVYPSLSPNAPITL